MTYPVTCESERGIADPKGGVVKAKRILLSVTNKEQGLDKLVGAMVEFCGNEDSPLEILATGGSLKWLCDLSSRSNFGGRLRIVSIEKFTGSGEVLNGRVKTLHPKLYMGILANRSNEEHMAYFSNSDNKWDDLRPVDIVIVNLYDFGAAQSVESIDVGGTSLLRAASKNFASVCAIHSPDQYEALRNQLCMHRGTTTEFRRLTAAQTFSSIAAYDSMIARWMWMPMATKSPVDPSLSPRSLIIALKYGDNPSQVPAYAVGIESGSLARRVVAVAEKCIGPSVPHSESPCDIGAIKTNPQSPPLLEVDCRSPKLSSLPFSVLNGTPSYTNLLDSLRAWALVCQLAAALAKIRPKKQQDTATMFSCKQEFHTAVAASFKHGNPAGVGVGSSELLPSELRRLGRCRDELCAGSPAARALLRARSSDALASFGDFLAISVPVNHETAMLLKPEVTDGIIAPAFSDDAIQVLSKKKNGSYVILAADIAQAISGCCDSDNDVDKGRENAPPSLELREINSVALLQPSHSGTPLGYAKLRPTSKGELEAAERTSLLIAGVTLKHATSNSICIASPDQAIAISAGHQSRVDAVRACCAKAIKWILLAHPRVAALPLKATGLKRADRVNARTQFVELSVELGCLSNRSAVLRRWMTQFVDGAALPSEVEPLSGMEVRQWILERFPAELQTESELRLRTSSTGGDETLTWLGRPLVAFSDGFFPFRDSIDELGNLQSLVSIIAHPGGSVADSAVADAADDYNMSIVETGVRLFLH